MSPLSLGFGIGLSSVGGNVGLLDQLTALNSRPVSCNAVFPTIRATNELANSYKVNGAAHVIDTSAALLANRVQEYGEKCGPSAIPDIEEGHVARYSAYPTIVEGRVALDGIGQTGAASGDCFVGFEIGSLNSNTPFSASPTVPVVQVRFHRPHNKVELFTCDGSHAAATLATSATFNGVQNQGVRVRLELYPGVRVKLSVWDPVNQVISSVTQSDTTKIPALSFGYQSGFAFILCTGASAGGLQASFSNFWIHTLTNAWGF